MVDRAHPQQSMQPIGTVLDWIEDACVVFDHRLVCIYANEAGSALLGVDAGDLVGRSLSATLPTKVGSEFQQAVQSAFKDQARARVTLRDDSTARWLQVALYPSADGLLAIIADITAERHQEIELATRTECLQQLVDQIPAFLWVIDRNLIVRRIEGGTSMMATLNRDRLIGKPMQEITAMGSSAKDLQLSIDMHKRVLQGTSERYRAAWKGIMIEARIRPLRDHTNKIVGIVGVGIDVTEQTRIQEQLQGSKERFRALIEGSTDLISIFDEELHLLYASPAHENVLGYTEAELKSMDPFSLMHPDDEDYLRAQYKTVECGRSKRVPRPVRARNKNGEWKTFVVTLTNLRKSEHVGGMVANSRDVTKELELETQLRQSQKLEALGQLAGGVAHDFNNVLAAIDGFARILTEDLAANDPRRSDASQILKAAERGMRITRQLLAFARHQVPTTSRLDLVEVVNDLRGMLRALLPATIDLRVAPEPGAAPIAVNADRSQLEQVIINLVVNARDAMPAGGILSIEARVGTTPDTAHTATIEVTDTGVGMSPEVQARVFEPFFTTKEPGRGTGLGLAMVYGVVRQHSGAIDIASVVGRGTTVTVRLPAATSAAETGLAPAQPAMTQDHHGRVLVVEDEEQVRDITVRFLQRAGYDVVTASDASAALGLIESATPLDLVLTDSAMPGMRGEDLAQEVVRIQPGLPVIVMSGYADSDSAHTSSAVVSFVQKPFTTEALLGEVRRAIRPH